MVTNLKAAMLSLLNWKKLPPTQLPNILNRFTYVTTIEVLKVSLVNESQTLKKYLVFERNF